MSVDKACEKILRQVCTSKLDFHMNQTPYSMYFSIRKKFLKGFNPNDSENVESSTNTNDDLFYVKNEYQKLYDKYQAAVANQNVLMDEICKLKHELDNKCVLEENFEETKNKNDVKNKALIKELSESKEKYKKKCSEFKTLKDEMDTIEKENNSAASALQQSRKKKHEIVKKYEKKLQEYDKKVGELLEYKKMKMNAERDLKLKQRKEIKKLNQINKKEEKVEVENGETNSIDIKESEDVSDPIIFVSNPYDILNPLLPSSSSTPCSPDSTTHEITFTSNEAATLHKSEKMNDAINNEMAHDSSLACTTNLNITSSNSNTSNSTPNISTDQTFLDEEFKTKVTEMIGQYKENKDCSVS